jgi:hypothetical protein
VHDLERLTAIIGALVRIVQAAPHLAHDEGRDIRRQALFVLTGAPHQLAQVGTLDVLHAEQLPRFPGVLEVVHLDDVRVVEPRGEARLLSKHRAKIVGGDVRREDALHHQELVGALRPSALGEEHLRHAARAEPPHQLKISEMPGNAARGVVHAEPCQFGMESLEKQKARDSRSAPDPAALGSLGGRVGLLRAAQSIDIVYARD